MRNIVRGGQKIGKHKKLIFGKYKKVLVIKINHHTAGFFAYFIFALNQLRYCERHHYFPVVYFGERSGSGDNAYFDRRHGENMWDYYFEPVAGFTYAEIQKMINDPKNDLEQEDLVELTDEDLWYLHMFDPGSIYGYTYGFYQLKVKYDDTWYKNQRRKARYYVEQYVRVKGHIGSKVKEFYDKQMKGCGILGVHIRGTDKGFAMASSNVQRIIWPEAYFRVIDQYLREHPACRIFIATDQAQYLEVMKNKYNDRVIHYDAIRSESKLNPFQIEDGKNYKKGEDALIDCLLLSKCDFLLKCASHLSETAMYFNPRLECLDLNYMP